LFLIVLFLERISNRLAPVPSYCIPSFEIDEIYVLQDFPESFVFSSFLYVFYACTARIFDLQK